MLKVDFAALEELSGTMERTIGEAEDILSTLGAQVAQVAEMWTGAASDGFQRTLADWMTGQQDLRRRLRDLRELVVTARDNQARAVRRNVAIWRV